MSRARNSFWLILLSTQIAGAQAVTPPTPTVPVPAPIVSKDWSLDANSCVASTTAVYKTVVVAPAIPTMVSFRLEVAIDKAKLRPAEVRIIPSAELVPATLGIKFVQDKKTTYAFAPLAPEAGQTVNSFWNVPRGTQALISYLKRENKLTVSLVDQTGLGLPLAFSLRGSSATLDQLSKLCNAKQDIAADSFERAFLPANVANVDPTKMQPADTAKLRDLVSTAIQAYTSSNSSQTQLNAISKQYMTQIAEYEKLRSNLDKLTNDTVAKLNSRQTQSQANIDKANIEIPQFRAQITQQEADLQVANTALDAANADIAPLLPTLSQYRSAVNNAQSNLDSARSSLSDANTYESQTRSRLAQIDSGIAQANADIISIQSSIQSVRWDLQNAQNDANSKQRDYSNAQSNRQRFDRNGETQSRLSRDSRLSSIESDMRNTQGQWDQARQRSGDADRRRQQAHSGLDQCRGGGGGFGGGGRGGGGRGPGGPGGGPGGPDGQPGGDMPPPPPPPPDCNSQESDASRADSDADSCRRDMDQYDSRMRDLKNQADRCRDDIRNDVDRQYNDLVRCEQDAQNKYNDSQSRANDLQNKLNRLSNSDLPQAQSSLSSYQSSRPGAVNDINSAVNSVSSWEHEVSRADNAVDRAQTNLNNWKASSGYNAKKAVLTAAQTKVDDTKTTLRHLDENIASRQKQIAAETKNLADIAAAMQIAVNTIAQKEARSQDVQKILAPYFLQRDALANSKASTDQTFKDSQASFASGLPQLVL